MIWGDGVPWWAYFSQACAAAWNSGEAVAPLTFSALMTGEAGSSGKFKTPCERMQPAYLTNWRLEGPSAAAAPAGSAVVVVPTRATLARGEPPPQAAVARTRPMTAEATSGSGRRPDRPLSRAPRPTDKRCQNGWPWRRALGWSMEQTVRKTL